MPNGVLLILAHPDDESFMVAGTARALVDRGVPVALVCATRGQSGSAGEPPLGTRDELPALRERELRAACAILGIAPVEVLEYHDRQLAGAPIDAIRASLVRAIRRERPRVVVTFDPHGVNGHPDHVAISGFALDAVTAAADARWCPDAGLAHRVSRIVWPSPVEPWREWRPDVLAGCAGVDFVIDVSATRAAKAAALRAHRTQHQSIEPRWFAPAESEAILSTEAFRLGWGQPPTVRPAPDLFDGL
jgi:LmbE family N-acetylglucosaminyl deacetylase